MPSSNKDLIQVSLQEFNTRLHSSVPLRHFSEHQDEDSVRKAAQQIGDEVFWKHFMRKVKSSGVPIDKRGELVNKFSAELKLLTDEYVAKNQDCTTESESFLQEKIQVISDDFRTLLEAKFLVNPEMDLKTFEECFERRKLSAMSYFEEMWELGNLGAFEKQKGKLEQKLDDLKKEMLEKQSRHLEKKVEEDAWKLVQDVKVIVLEMCRQIKYDFEGKEHDLKLTLKENVRSILDYLNGKGSLLNEKYGKLYTDLQEVLKDAMKCLTEEQEGMSVEDANEWVKMLELQLKSLFSEPEIQQERNASRPMMVCESVLPDLNGNGSHSNRMDQSVAAKKLLASESIVLAAKNDMVDNTVEVASESRSRSHTELSSVLAVPQSHSSKKSASEQHGTVFVDMEADVPPESSNVDECCASQRNESNGAEKVSSTMSKECTSEARKEVPVLKKHKVINRGVVLQGAVKRVNPDNQEVPKEVVCPPVSKKSKRMTPESESSSSIGNNLNVPDKNGFTPFLLAIREGQDVSCIEEMLDNGADVNTTTNDRKENAVHQVIWSLIKGKRKVEGALAVLNLLVTRGFKLINDENCGFTPLFLAMQYKGLNEDLLDWFFDNGANFNAVDRDWNKNSVLLQAISQRQGAGVLRKILYFGGNSKHVNKHKWNVLHTAANNANDSALKLFIDQFDINGTTMHKLTPLHLLFVKNDLDFQECLKVLLQKGADFYAEDRNGYIPLVRWIKRSGNNCFQTLDEIKDTLPVTPDIASAALTAIVEEMEQLKEFLPRRENPGLYEFIVFLIKEKNGSLQLKDEGQWKSYDWQKLKDIIVTREFVKELNRGCTGTRIALPRAHALITATMLGKLEFGSKYYTFILPIEDVLSCLLTGLNYHGFVETCRCLKTFCGPVSR